MAIRAKRFRVKMTSFMRLRQAGARLARLVETATVPSELNEARLIARKINRDKTYHRCLYLDFTLEDEGTDRGATSAILMWQCAWVER